MDTSTVGLIGIGISLLVTGANAAFVIVIKFNDMFHLGQDVKEISANIKELAKAVEKNDKDIAVMKEGCKERHKNL